MRPSRQKHPVPATDARHAPGIAGQSEIALSGGLEDAVRISDHDEQAAVLADVQAGTRVPLQRRGDVAIGNAAAMPGRR